MNRTTGKQAGGSRARKPRALPRIAFLGAGHLTRALLPAVVDAGWPVSGVVARRPGSARSAVRSVGGIPTSKHARPVVGQANVVLFAVIDTAVAQVAEELADRIDWEGKIALHHAGAFGPDELAVLRQRGAAVGVLHPLQVLGTAGLAQQVLPGSAARIEGDPAAVRLARRLARSLGLHPLTASRDVTDVDRTLYHAGAALVSNDLVALLGLATELFEASGFSQHEARRALTRLARGTLLQAERRGISGALTGPVVRGDAATLEKHLAQLDRTAPETAAVHRTLSGRLLGMAEEAGQAPTPAVRRRIRGLLRPSGGRRTGRGV